MPPGGGGFPKGFAGMNFEGMEPTKGQALKDFVRPEFTFLEGAILIFKSPQSVDLTELAKYVAKKRCHFRCSLISATDKAN